MNITIIYFITQSLLRINLVLEQRPEFFEGLDTMFDGLLWDTGTWFIIFLPLLLITRFVSKKQFKRVDEISIPFFFVLGCVDYLWLKRIHPISLDWVEVCILISGFTLITSYSASQVKVRFPELSQKRVLAMASVATLGFVLVINPWLEKHDHNLMDDKLARNGIYEKIFH